VSAPHGKRDAIVGVLTHEIVTGVYSHDDGRLPSESELCARFDVSRITVRNALERLATAGLVIPKQREGWFVRGDHRRRYPLLTIDERGGTIRDVWRTWLCKENLHGDHQLTVTIGLPPHHVMEHLQLTPGDQCAIRHRIRRINDEPVMFSTAYFPMWLAEGTPLAVTGTGDAVDLNKPSPLDILANLGHVIAADEDQIGGRMPEPHEAEELQLPLRGIPVLTNCRTSFNTHGVPIRCTHDVMASHRFLLVVHQKRPVRETAS